MKFPESDHHCDGNAEYETPYVTNGGEMVERRGVCQLCGRVVIEQYDLKRIQDAETGEFVTYD